MASTVMPEVETAHHAASLLARDMASWNTMRISPDAALLPELDTMSARIDDLVRNNGIASGAERTFVDNVVGPRVTCKPNPDRIALGRDAAWADAWSRQVESLWSSFADTDWYDAGLRYNFHVSTRLSVRMIAATGEAVALPMWTQRSGSRWNTCMRLVDPARLSNPQGRADSATMRGGIEIDPVTTAAVAYNIRKTHPGDIFGLSSLGSFGMGEWERIPAYMEHGRRRVIHLYESDRVGQTRGKAAITSVARQFRMVDKFSTEQLRLAVLNSLIFAALETPMTPEGIAGLIADNADAIGSQNPLQAYQALLNEYRVQMKGGAMLALPPGTKMSSFNPSQNLTALDSFFEVMLRQVGAGLNLGYELTTKDFSKSNYSSARAALLEAWRYFTSVRQFIIDHWCSVNFDLWFEEAVNRGVIPDCTPDDYYQNQVAWTRCKWIFAGRGWVDPFKEAKGAQIRLQAGIDTYSDASGEQGRDWRGQMDQLATEYAYAREIGLPWPPAAPVASAASAQADDTAALDGD